MWLKSQGRLGDWQAVLLPRSLCCSLGLGARHGWDDIRVELCDVLGLSHLLLTAEIVEMFMYLAQVSCG